MAKLKYNKPRRIAPRLANGDHRAACAHGLPPHIKEALQMLAYEKGESLSWVLEKKLIQSFGLERPEYVPPKKKER